MKQIPEGNGDHNLPIRPQYIDVPPAQAIIDEEQPSLLLEYWRLLRRHKGTLLLITLLGIIAALLLTLPQTPVYQASATLEVMGLNENFLNMRDVSPTAREGGSYPPEYDLQTQVNILQSRSVLERVNARLKLEERLSDKDKGRLRAWRKALGLPGPRVSARDEILELVAKNLHVSTQASTRLVEILYDSTDPQLASDVVNSVTEEFIQQNLEARWQTSQRTGEYLTRQLDDLKIKIEHADERLQSYAAATGLMFTAEKDNIAEEKLRQLQEELSKAQADRVTRQSRYEMATTSSPEALPDVLDNSSLLDYQSKLTDLRRQFAELRSTLKESHPNVKRVQAQIATLESALEKQRTNIVNRIRNEFETSQRREKLLAGDYAAQAKLVGTQAAQVSHYNILKREADTNRQLYETMLQKMKEAGIASAMQASNIRVVDTAEPPPLPHKPRLVLNVALGMFSGLMLGVVFVVMRDNADRSLRAPGDSAFYIQAPELGVIPSAQAARKALCYYYRNRAEAKSAEKHMGEVELVTSQRKPSILAESFRAALASILFSGNNGARPRVIVLTSPALGEGKTTVATNLALALAEIHRRVLLIDADLRRPRLHEIFHLSNEWGLSDLLLGKVSPTGYEGLGLRTEYQELHLLPAGSRNGSISGLLHSTLMPEVLARARKEYDTVIIDTPPMLQIADARVLGRLADGVILVVRSNETTRDTIHAASQRLLEDGTRIIGTILNYWDPRKSHDGNRLYHHYRAS